MSSAVRAEMAGEQATAVSRRRSRQASRIALWLAVAHALGA